MSEQTTAPAPSAEARLDALTKIRAAMPELGPEEAMRAAEWLLTGAVLLDPKRLKLAAVEAAWRRGDVYDALDQSDRARYLGDAALIVTAYLRS